MPRLSTQKEIQEKSTEFLPVVLGKKLGKKPLKQKEMSKLDMFEAGLAGELKTSDTWEGSVEKMVRMALVSEFGAGLLTSPGAKKMVAAISRGILSDRELRRSALIIADRFSASKTAKPVMLRSKKKGKAVLNG